MIPFVSSWGIAVPALWKAAGDLAEGTINSNVVTVDGPQSPERAAVIAEYHKRYNQDFDDPASFFDAYDAVDPAQHARWTRPVSSRRRSAPRWNRSRATRASVSASIIRYSPKNAMKAHALDDMMMGRWTGGKFLSVSYDAGGPYITPTEGQKKYIDPKSFALR